MSQYSFNLDDQKELSTARKVLDAIDSMKSQTTNTQFKNEFWGNQNRSSQNDFRQQSQEYQQCLAENKKLKEELQSITNQKETDTVKINDLITEITKKTEEVNKLAELVNSSDISIKRKNAEIEALNKELYRLQDQKNAIERQLQTKIQELQRRLDAYEPSFAGADGEEQYYNISNGILTQTNSVDAPYKARIFSNGKASFQFNVDKGPCKEACNYKDKFILPFCEIEEEQLQSNCIRPGQWGEALYNSAGDLSVIIKAKVKLIRS